MHWPGGAKPREPWAIICALFALMLGGFVAGCAFRAGWMVLGLAAMFGQILFHHCRGSGTVEVLAEQLAKRPSFPAGAWGSDDRAAFAAGVGRIVADEVGWPNSHFLPDDPMEIVFYCPSGDGAEGLVISVNFEKVFGRKCDFSGVKTFGEFIDRNLPRSAT
jgi:hypothetical protein